MTETKMPKSVMVSLKGSKSNLQEVKLAGKSKAMTGAPLRILRSTRKRRGAGSQLSRASVVPRLPPTIDANPVLTSVLRFTNTSDITSSANQVTIGNIFLALGFMCRVTNSTVDGIASSFRMNKIILWPSVNTTSGSSNNPTIEEGPSIDGSPDKGKLKSLPAGITSSAPVVWRPQGVFTSNWINASLLNLPLATVLLEFFQCAKGAILDLHIAYTLRNSDAGVSSTVVTGTAGNFYWGYLDGQTTHVWAPEGRPSTV